MHDDKKKDWIRVEAFDKTTRAHATEETERDTNQKMEKTIIIMQIDISMCFDLWTWQSELDDREQLTRDRDKHNRWLWTGFFGIRTLFGIIIVHNPQSAYIGMIWNDINIIVINSKRLIYLALAFNCLTIWWNHCGGRIVQWSFPHQVVQHLSRTHTHTQSINNEKMNLTTIDVYTDLRRCNRASHSEWAH